MCKNEIRKTTLISEFNHILIQFGVQRLIFNNLGDDASDIYCDLISCLCETSQQFGSDLVIDKVYSSEL